MEFCILYSSFNNYSILKDFSLPRLNAEDTLIINVDDHSFNCNKAEGRSICEQNNIIFLENEGKGVQFAVNTCINYLNKNHPDISWIFVLQHDIVPLTPNFFTKLKTIFSSYDISDIGAIGFNILDDDNGYAPGAYDSYLKGNNPDGALKIAFLSDSKSDFKRLTLFMFVLKYILILAHLIKLSFPLLNKIQKKFTRHLNNRRVVSPKTCKSFHSLMKSYPRFFKCELPFWPAIMISKVNWENHVTPDKNFIFHLWFNDIAMQFLNSNVHCAVNRDLYLLNCQSIKLKYGFEKSSAIAGVKNNTNHVEKYGPHLINFQNKWYFDYENPRAYNHVFRKHYINSLVYKYFNHDFRKGPLENISKINE